MSVFTAMMIAGGVIWLFAIVSVYRNAGTPTANYWIKVMWTAWAVYFIATLLDP